MKVLNYPETLIHGMVSIENDNHEEIKALLDQKSLSCDISIQVAVDGHVWINIGGISFLRVMPMDDGLFNDRRTKHCCLTMPAGMRIEQRQAVENGVIKVYTAWYLVSEGLDRSVEIAETPFKYCPYCGIKFLTR